MNNEYNKLEYDEMEISFKRIIKQCINKIRLIIIVALLFAIIIPSLVYIKEMRDYKNEISILEHEEGIKLTEEEKTEVERYRLFEQSIAFYDLYEANAPILKMDFHNVYTGSLQYYVDADESIKEGIATAITNYFVVEKLAEKLGGLEAVYYKDIVDVAALEKNNGIISIKFWTKNEEDCKLYSATIREIISEYSETMQTSIGKHSLNIVHDEISCGFENQVLALQSDFYINKRNILSEFKNLDGRLTEAQKKIIYEHESNLEKIPLQPKVDIKYAIFGAVVGFIFGVAVVSAITIFDGRLQTEYQLEKSFGLKCLGRMFLEVSNEKRVKSKIMELQLELLAKNMVKCLEQYECKEVYLISTIRITEISELKKICDILNSRGIECKIVDNVVDQNFDRNKMMNKKTIIVEEIGKTLIKEVDLEIKLCELTENNLLGYVCMTN